MPASPLQIVFLDAGSFGTEVRLPDFGFAHEMTEHEHTLPDQVLERARGADIILTNKVPVRRDSIEKLERLKLIGVTATGTDCVDKEACAEHGIGVVNVTGYATTSVPEHVMGMMLTLQRNLVAYGASVAQGRWQQSKHFCYLDFPIKDLGGSTLGMVGSGSLGRATARLAEAFGMEVIYADRKGSPTARDGYVPFAEMLARADVISLHCPLTPETHHLLGEAEFKAMAARRPLILNTARGPLIDDMALIKALDAGWISGAGLDVISQEPPPADHPLLGLAGRPNVLITPHVAWASRNTMEALCTQLVDNVNRYVAENIS
ncbi:MAG: D-2-hydroxyacid dehydrogenase [Rhodospirillaceae bacterium]